MLSGYNPYKIQDFGGNTNMMFEMIVNDQIQFNFPKKLTPDAKSLIKGLMTKDPRKRLGSSKKGIQEIKDHMFFSCIDWEKLEEKQLPVPFKPTLQSNIDTKYVDKEFLR